MQNFELYFSFGLYLILILAIGIIAYKATKNYDDYVLGGRKMGSFITAMSAGASDMSGWLLLGLPGAIYLIGLSEAWIAVGLTIGAYFNYRIVARRLRSFTEQYDNSLTLPDFIAARFPSSGKTLKLLSSSVILFFFTIYCASGIVAGAKLFTNLFDITYQQGLWLGALATLSYTFLGGYLAVSWSDSIQASLMIFALILGPVLILTNYSWSEITVALENKTTVTQIPYSNWLFNVSGLGVISALSWGLGYFGQPHILTRFMAADSVKSLNSARRIGIAWMIICLASACAVGYFGLAYFTLNGHEISNAELVFIELSKAIFNPWVVGIVLSAILAAIMSTLSAQFLMCSTSLTNDFYHGYVRKNASQKELIWVGRSAIVLIAVIAIIIAQDPNSKVMDLVKYAWAGFASAFGPLVILSLFSRNITPKAALFGMISGSVTVVVWNPIMNFWGWKDLSQLYAIVPGFIISSLVILTISIISRTDEEMAKKFDAAVEKYLAEK